MTITAYLHSDMALCDQRGRKISLDMPFLLSLVEQEADERQTPNMMPEIASHLTRLVAQRLPVTTAPPLCWAEQADEEDTFADQMYLTLAASLKQGFRRLLLVPWGGRQSTGTLVAPVLRALSFVTGEVISRTELALPHVHVDGVSARSVFGGLSSIETQLGPLLEAFPGWDRTWTKLSAGDVMILVLRSGGLTAQPSLTAAWESPTRKALAAALCPQQVGFMTTSDRSRWQRDGEIYAHYLISLLCAAMDFLQQEQT
jgi:hypothetical protein